MDPNTTYGWIKEAWVRFDAAAGDAPEQGNIAREIHDYYAALDQWLSRGGFLPDAWQR